jgi:hypothetical protein
MDKDVVNVALANLSKHSLLSADAAMHKKVPLAVIDGATRDYGEGSPEPVMDGSTHNPGDEVDIGDIVHLDYNSSDYVTDMWYAGSEHADVKIVCDTPPMGGEPEWFTVKIYADVGILCRFETAGTLAADDGEPIDFLDDHGLTKRIASPDKWNYVVTPGRTYDVGDAVKPKDCNTWWPWHGVCPDADPSCTLSDSQDAQLRCDGTQGKFDPLFGGDINSGGTGGVKFSDRVMNSTKDGLKKSCDVRDSTLATLLEADGLQKKSNDASLAEGHIEPGYRFQIGTAVRERDNLQVNGYWNKWYFSKRPEVAQLLPAHVTALCDGDTGGFRDLEIDRTEVIQGRQCGRHQTELEPKLNAFGLTKTQTADYFQANYDAPEGSFEIGTQVEALSTYYYTGTYDADITVVCDGATGEFGPPQPSTEVVVLDDQSTIVRTCHSEPTADRSNLAALLNQSHIGLDLVGGYVGEETAPKQAVSTARLEIGDSLQGKDMYVVKGSGSPATETATAIPPTPCDINGNLDNCEIAAKTRLSARDVERGLQPQHVTAQCNGNDGTFEVLYVDYDNVTLGRVCFRSGNYSNLNSYLEPFELTLKRNQPTLAPGEYTEANEPFLIGQLVEGLYGAFYDGVKMEDVKVYCNGATGDFHGFWASAQGMPKDLCNAQSGGGTGWSQLGDILAAEGLEWTDAAKESGGKIFNGTEVLPDATFEIGDAVQALTGPSPKFPPAGTGPSGATDQYYKAVFYGNGAASDVSVKCDGASGSFKATSLYIKTEDATGDALYATKCDEQHTSVDSLLTNFGLKKSAAWNDAALLPSSATGFPSYIYQEVGSLWDIGSYVELANGDPVSSSVLNEGISVQCHPQGYFSRIQYGAGSESCRPDRKQANALGGMEDLNEYLLSGAQLVADLKDQFYDGTVVGPGTYLDVGAKVTGRGDSFYPGSRPTDVRLFCNGTTGFFDAVEFPEHCLDAAGDAVEPCATPHCGDASTGATDCTPLTKCDFTNPRLDEIIGGMQLKRKANHAAFSGTHGDQRAAPGMVQIGDGLELDEATWPGMAYSGYDIRVRCNNEGVWDPDYSDDTTKGSFTYDDNGVTKTGTGYTLGAGTVLGTRCPKAGGPEIAGTGGNALDGKLRAQNLDKDRDNFPTQGDVTPGDYWNIADLIQAKSEDHYYSGNEEDTPANANQVRVRCPMDFTGIFDFTDKDANGDQSDEFIDFTGSRGPHVIDHGAKCAVEQAALETLLDTNGLKWKKALAGTLDTVSAPLPGRDFDISQMVEELDDANRGKQYYLARLGDESTWAPGISRVDIEPNSITITCDRRGGAFSNFQATGVVLGQKCFKNQLKNRASDNLASHNLERKPDSNGESFGAWSGYTAPGKTFGFADKVQGISQMHAGGDMISLWGTKAADFTTVNSISATCDNADGTYGDITFASDEWKPRKKCPKKIDTSGGDVDKASSLLSGEGLKVDTTTGGDNDNEDGTNFILAGEDFDVGDRIEALNTSWHYSAAGQGAQAVKLTCANTLDSTTEGTYTIIAVDRGSGVVAGKICNLAQGQNSAQSLGEKLQENNLEHIPAVGNQQIEPASTASILSDVRGAGEDLSEVTFSGVRYHLKPHSGDVEAVCHETSGLIIDVTVSGDASIGKYCEASDASLPPLLAAKGLQITSLGVQNADPTVPEAWLDLAKVDELDALDETWHYELATGASQDAIRAKCNVTTGEFDLVERDSITDLTNIDLGQKCALIADDGKTAGGNLAANLAANHFILQAPDMRVFNEDNGVLPMANSSDTFVQNDLKQYTFGSTGWTTSTRTYVLPRGTINVGKLVTADPATHNYQCTSKNERDPDAANDTTRCQQNYSSDALANPSVPTLTGCNCKPEYVVVSCNGANGEFDSVAVEQGEGNGGTMFLDSYMIPLLKPLEYCDAADVDSGSLDALLAVSGLSRKADVTLGGVPAVSTAPGAKLDIGAAVEALDETWYTTASQAADVQLACNGKTGLYDAISFAAGKDPQRTCSKAGADIAGALYNQGLEVKDDYEDSGYVVPGTILSLGTSVKANEETHEPGTYKRNGGAFSSDFTIECKNDGTFFDAQFADAADKPDVKDGTATVITATLGLVLEVGGGGGQQVDFSEDADFRALVEQAVRDVITDPTVGDNLRSVSIGSIQQSSASSRRRQLSVDVAARVQAGMSGAAGRRQLQEQVGLDVEYNIILANDVPEAVVQNVMAKVSNDDSEAAELFALKMDDSLTEQFRLQMEADQAAAASGSPVKPRLYQVAAVTANSEAGRSYAARDANGNYIGYGGARGPSNTMYGRGRGGTSGNTEGNLVSAAFASRVSSLSVLIAALVVAGWAH